MANGRTLTEKMSTPVEPQLRKALENIAKRDYVPVTQVCRRAFRDYVAKEARK